MTELVKLVTCLVIVFFEEDRSVKQFGTVLYKTILKNKIDTLKVCGPALLYVIQNNILYLAASHLDAASYQVCICFSNQIHLYESINQSIEFDFCTHFYRSVSSLQL